MAHELLGAENTMALDALYTPRVKVRVQVGHVEARAPAEALVVHFHLKQGLHVRIRDDLRRIAVQKGGAEPLGVRFSDEAAAGRTQGQDTGRLQDLELFGVAARAENVQSVAHAVDLCQAESPEHRVQDLR